MYSDSDEPALQTRDANLAGLHLSLDGLPWGAASLAAGLELRRLQESALQCQLDLQDLDYKVTIAYLSVLEASANDEAIGKVRNKIKDELERYLPGFQAGGGPVLEQVKVQSFVAVLEGQWGQARLQRQANEDELRRLLGLPIDASMELEPVTDSDADTACGEAPQLGLLEAAALSQEARLSQIRLRRLPQLEAGADYGYAGREWNGQSLGWGVRLGLSLPIWDWGRLNADAGEASAQLALLRLRQVEGRESLAAECRQLQRQVASMQGDQRRLAALLPRLEAAATSSARRYRLASLTLLDVTDIYSQWLQTLQAERSAHFDRLEALARLQQLRGPAHAR